MKLKQLTLLTALAGLLLATASCAKDDTPGLVNPDGTVPVTFIAHLPGKIDSREISDGTKANQLFFWVFDESGKELKELRQTKVEFDATNAGKVTANLLPGHNYKFAFWAQTTDYGAYIPEDLITANYENIKCNDELRDAFYGWIPDLKVNVAGELTQEIVLTRRLAQLNIGISPEAVWYASMSGYDFTTMKSEVTIKVSSTTQEGHLNNYAAYTQFNLLEDEVEDFIFDPQELTFSATQVPNEQLYADYAYWDYLAMNYFFTTIKDPSLIDVHLRLIDKSGKELEFDFYGVPVQGHERTNLLIDGLTEEVSFNVVVDENFENEDQNIVIKNGTPYHAVKNASTLKTYLEKGENVLLQDDITLTEGTSLVVPATGNCILDLNGHTLANAVKAGPALLNQGTLTLLGGTIVNNNQEEQGADAVRNDGGTLIIESGTYGSDNNRGAAVRNNGGTVTINGGTFATIDRGLDKGYDYVFINNAADAVMTINNATSDCDPNGMFAANAGTITVNGGSYTMGDPNKPTYYLFYAEQGTINVNAGTYNWTHGTSANVYQCIDGSGTINIADGVTINATYK